MQVSVETLKGLERKVTISVPAETVEEEVGLRLKDLARNAKVDGFRQGKAPPHIIKSRFSEGAREEVARKLVESTLYEALKNENLTPASHPSIEPQQLVAGKDFIFTATFEVFPSIEIKELDNPTIEVIDAVVKDSDVAALLEKLREQAKVWKEVERGAAKGDKVKIDFVGSVDGNVFEGGSATDYEIELGSGSMIPGFEEGLIGANKGDEFEIKVTFPKDYAHAELADKKANFKITMHQVFEGELPALDEKFAEKFNIKEGGIKALKKDIKENMVRELERRVAQLKRDKVYDAMLAINSFELPTFLVEKEIENLKHEMYHRLFGNEHSDNEKIPDFPRELFEEQAKRRVHLGLLFSEYVKKHNLTPDETIIEKKIDSLASAFEKPEELRTWYYANPKRLEEVRALVIEEMFAEKAAENVKFVEKEMTYDEVMNPKKEKAHKEDK